MQSLKFILFYTKLVVRSLFTDRFSSYVQLQKV